MRHLEGFYSIIDYTVPASESVTSVAEAFGRIQRDWVAQYKGFVSARFLAKTDGSTVRVIVEWVDENAFHDFERNSDTQRRIGALNDAFQRLSTTGSRHTFTAIGEVLPRQAARN